MILRQEIAADVVALETINTLAFGRPNEAALVAALRAQAHPFLSLVAEIQGQIVGHICFSPITINGDYETSTEIGLAPLAVLPGWQNRGVGSALVRVGLAECQRLGSHVVVVLGHPDYYPRFGFTVASAKGLRCEYDVRDEAFMVAELTPGALAGRTGLVKYHPAFQTV